MAPARPALALFTLFAGLVAAPRPALAGAAPAPAASLIASPEEGWPQFRGPRRDGISDERGLLPEWPADGPPLVATLTGLGKGFSSPVITGGRIFLTGDFGAETRILAFDLTGRPLWSAVNGAAWLNQYQGARGTVAVRGGRLYHQNAHGRVVCLDAATGRELWAVDLLQRFKGENITWGLSDCLLVDDRLVYTSPGGREASLVALDRETGAVRWQSPPQFLAESPDTPEGAGYAAPILVRFGERRLLVGNTQRHLYCVDADTGEVQWRRERKTPYSVIAMMPVLVGDAIFAPAPMSGAAGLHRLVPPATPAGKVGVTDVWSAQLDTCQGGVVHAGGRLFGSHYPKGRGWTALDARTGETLYNAPEFAKGSLLHADDRLYVLTEDGWALLVDPAAPAFALQGRFRFVTAKDRDAWAHPVIWDGQLFLRYHNTMEIRRIRK
jgi:outer membrane protein assembly factor BamB